MLKPIQVNYLTSQDYQLNVVMFDVIYVLLILMSLYLFLKKKNNSSHSTLIRATKIYFSHFTLIRVECEKLFCKTNIKSRLYNN